MAQVPITLPQLRAIVPYLEKNPAFAEGLYPGLLFALGLADIRSSLRVAGFLAQVAHECGQFRWMEELGDGSRYERPIVNGKPQAPAVDTQGRALYLWQRLGNTEVGDGPRFKGRGTIQLTGRDNYTRFSAWAGVDCVSRPELVATDLPHVVASYYWNQTKLNRFCDARDILGLSQMVYFGALKGPIEPAGWPDRMFFWNRALDVLGVR